MMQISKTSLKESLKIAFLATLLLAGAATAYAGTWAAPTAAPTGGEPDAPLVANGNQTKYGSLIVNDSTNGSYAATGLDVPNGNVGIGAGVPSAKLQIFGGDSSFALFGPNASWNSYLNIGSGSPSIASGKASVVSTNGNLHIDAGTGQGIYLGYFTADNTYINPNGGNVGIGTQSPARPLEVNNAMKFTNGSADPNDGVIGTAPFLAGLNIVGINTDGGGRKINVWGTIIQNQGDICISGGKCLSTAGGGSVGTLSVAYASVIHPANTTSAVGVTCSSGVATAGGINGSGANEYTYSSGGSSYPDGSGGWACHGPYGVQWACWAACTTLQ